MISRTRAFTLAGVRALCWLRGDLRERLLQLGPVGVRASEQPGARLGIVRDGRQRLIELMRYPGGHLTDGGHAGYVQQPTVQRRRRSTLVHTIGFGIH
jgi:hypothetical protein